MSLQNVVPGSYAATVKDWGLREVPQLNNAIEAWIAFEFSDLSGAGQSISFRSLVMTKGGTINKKLMKTLETCGYAHVNSADQTLDLVPFMELTALDTSVQVEIEIVDKPSKDGLKTYKEIEWVNSIGAPRPNAVQSKSLAERLIADGIGKPKAKPRNMAPQTTAADEKLPF